ncbi:hypothetical protein KUTeg_005025 [Tegillarca granosa]|uniref:Uncharacterized protein n=1 Tax=Tegillarca granosa TaxID=220873 RepID=A0ABQ9FIK8_TEGGR|nr:hypothetical protein KUTeg_005025 [Tegillarca granosa]
MVSLCSKTYIVRNSKGVSKRNIKSPMSIFRKVLNTRLSYYCTNTGFRARGNTIYSYSLLKRGFGYFNCKRKVLRGRHQ